MPTMNKLKQINGFTIAELLVVVTIIGILVAVSIPIFTSQLNKVREAADLANERAAKAAALADFYVNGYDIKSGGPLNGHFYQYEYDARTGQVILQIDENIDKIKRIQPYGHKYKLTKKDPTRMISGWCLFFTELNNRMLMNVCIPYSDSHSRIGRRLNGERMEEYGGDGDAS
jgi:prepilin-type N-terminal cleavage/methylation domain-containing protein